MAIGETFEIPSTRFEWFKSRVAKLSTRCEKLVGERITMMVIGKRPVDEAENRRFKGMMYQVFVTCPETKIAGWEFVARLDHSQEAGTIIYSIPTCEVPARFRAVGRHCEHCNINRRRRDTFVLRCLADDTHKQIGSSCLKDFIGHTDVSKLAKLADLLCELGDVINGRGFGKHPLGSEMVIDHRIVDAREYAAAVAQTILNSGNYRSKAWSVQNGGQSTAAVTMHNFSEVDFEITQQAKQIADAAISDCMSWSQNRFMSTFQNNAFVVASSQYLEVRQVNIMAALVGSYWLKHHKPTAGSNPVFAHGDHVGEVNQRVELDVTVRSVAQSQFSIRHVFNNGDNMLTWFATNEDLSDRKGQTIRISANVKSHTSYNGVKQTLINRVKVL